MKYSENTELMLPVLTLSNPASISLFTAVEIRRFSSVSLR
jgi:hypothetical protein